MTGQTVRQAIAEICREWNSRPRHEAMVTQMFRSLERTILEGLSARGLADLGVPQWVPGDQVNEAGMYWHCPPYMGVTPQLEIVFYCFDQWRTERGHALKPGDGWWQRCLAPAPPTLERGKDGGT